ncbi:carboxypeptidase regulatory-like domain-containing protein [Luteibaculum oceani]|uniref:TonB-dependent receptor plug domain-containing protein n=1 Tax=Luteibaculum oceani TaxID=1294296 RepID=A0A5C6UZE8_9FLAO|nr:carboxypeptidase regulatory-like domain-containing protein [Luteibaculum oceani]TXC78813.1 hypothetical protein FRX97_06270 [Luteibaculum oceani]
MGKKLCALLVAFICATVTYAQVGSGTLQGKVIDESTGEPLPFVNVAIFKGDKQIKGTTSDFNGKFTIKPIDPGQYDVQASFVGYTTKRVTDVIVRSNIITFQDMKLTSGVDLGEVEIVQYKKPLINKDGGASGGSVTSEEIAKMPTRSAAGIATTVGGVSTAGTGGGISIRGSRTGGNFIYIDGVKVRGSSSLPKSALQEVNVITGGVPANYGDATGGIISITTRGPASEFNGSVEAITSGFKVGDQQINLLDKFGSNILEASFSGPLIRKKNEDGTKGESLIGYRVSGNYTSNVDGQPSIIGHNVLSDEARAALIADPISRVPGAESGVNYNSSFLRKSDFTNVPTSINTENRNAFLQTKLTVDLGNDMDLTFGGSAVFSKNNGYSFVNHLMNADISPITTSLDYRGYVRFSHRLFNDQESEGLLKNLYYSIMLDYSKSYDKTESALHGDNYFAYGYNGKYNIFKDSAQWAFDTIFNGQPLFVRNAVDGDTLVTFERSMVNELSSNYVEAFFNEFDQNSQRYDRMDNLVGFRNGDGPDRLYGRFTNLGMPVGGYGINDDNQYRVSASGSADLGNHAVTLGFEYEQRVDRNWSFNGLAGDERNRNNNLWSVMRARANSHIKELFNEPVVIFDANGDTAQVLTPSPDTTEINGALYVNYATRIDSANQSYFDRSLRASLGLDPDGDDFINIDALDPSQFNIEFFSPLELLNNGGRLVNHRGFDIYGNKLNYNPSIEDYFNKRDANGNLEKPVAAFQPVYAAGYIMDKFSFDDIIFNVGLRVDRFDANQSVLKDPYLFRDAYTAGDYRSNDNINLGPDVVIPAGISDDAYVYVDNLDNPTQILGFREGNTFFNARGQVSTDDAIRTSTSEIAPYLKDRNDKSDVNAAAFEDYTPQINVMPRVAFSFPISDVALFFAHYDILTRRPVSSNALDLVRYEFIRNIGSSANSPLSNPNLLPEKTVDYAVGFQQALNKSSALKIEAFYREMRDQIQVFQYVGAYPQDYYSFDNLDFGTVKGLTIEYDLRATNNIGLNVNYTLQFADGTGSNAGGAVVNLNATDFSTLRTIAPLNNDQRHKFNARVDYRFGAGKNYNGPEGFARKIFEDFGANAVLAVGSGTPYTASSDPNASRLEGTINGSRLPWNTNINLVFDKSFTLGKVDGDDTKKGMNLNVFLLVNNVLNTRNIFGVYPFTGTPDDDGYLTDPRYQEIIRNQVSEASFRDIYSLWNTRPFNFGAPRTIQIGARLDF